MSVAADPSDGPRYIARRLRPQEVSGAMGAHRSGIRIFLLLPLTVIAGLLLGACSTFGVTPGSYGGTLVDTISVTGFGEATGSPDIATVQLGVNVTGADVGDAVGRSNSTMGDITVALVGRGGPAR